MPHGSGWGIDGWRRDALVALLIFAAAAVAAAVYFASVRVGVILPDGITASCGSVLAPGPTAPGLVCDPSLFAVGRTGLAVSAAVFGTLLIAVGLVALSARFPRRRP